MNIISNQFNINHNSLDIFLAGCKGKNGVHCDGCHNPQSWNFNQGEYYKEQIENINDKISKYDIMIDKVCIFGGEPLDQNIDELVDFINHIKKEIWLFTRFDIEEVDERVLEVVDYIKCGEYDNTKLTPYISFGFELASSNQKIFKR